MNKKHVKLAALYLAFGVPKINSLEAKTLGLYVSLFAK